MNKTGTIIIDSNDYDNSKKAFNNPHTCPAAIAFKRIFGSAGTFFESRILKWREDIERYEDIGTLDRPWDIDEFIALRDNQTTFTANYTLS